MYVLTLLDRYSTGLAVFVFAFIEIVLVSWNYGNNNIIIIMIIIIIIIITIIIIMIAEMTVFNVSGYLKEERRRWPVITASHGDNIPNKVSHALNARSTPAT